MVLSNALKIHHHEHYGFRNWQHGLAHEPAALRCRAQADEIGFTAPVTALFERLYAEGMEHGLSDLDHSGLFVELASRNGMD